MKKKSIDPQPIVSKPIPVSSSNLPPGLKVLPSAASAPVNKQQNNPNIVVNSSSSKESIESVAKVLSPPPNLQSSPQVTKISGPSFASALAAATAQSAISGPILQSNPSIKLTAKQFNTGAFEELETFFVKKFPVKDVESNVSKFLAISYQNLPDNYELERNRQYFPKQPYAVPSYYQSEPPQILSNPSIFERFDLDTLFFVFYYQQKTYPQ